MTRETLIFASEDFCFEARSYKNRKKVVTFYIKNDIENIEKNWVINDN